MNQKNVAHTHYSMEMRITLLVSDMIGCYYEKKNVAHTLFPIEMRITLLISDIIGCYCETKECSPHTFSYRNEDNPID